MTVRFIAIRVSEDENLMYLFYTEDIAFSVDSTEPELLLECLDKKFDKEYYLPSEIPSLPLTKPRRLMYSFTTHHHYDHSSGDRKLKQLVPDIIQVREGELTIGNIPVKCISTPCHTRDSICILVGDKYLCTGDTIFFLGCGCFFEGTAEEMLVNFNLIKQLSDNILYCMDTIIRIGI